MLLTSGIFRFSHQHTIYLQRALGMLSQLKLHIMRCVWKNLTHTQIHIHTEREPYKHRHTYTDENILGDVIQLFIYLLFIFTYLGVLQISGKGLGETELNQEEVDCELERRYISTIYISYYSR